MRRWKNRMALLGSACILTACGGSSAHEYANAETTESKMLPPALGGAQPRESETTETAAIQLAVATPQPGKKEAAEPLTQQQINQQHYLKLIQVMGGAYVTDPGLTQYVRTIGAKVAKASDRPDVPYEFVVLNTSTPTAWGLPGGKVGISRGLLANLESEAELASVLAHEVVHSSMRTEVTEAYGLIDEDGIFGVDKAVANPSFAAELLTSEGLAPLATGEQADLFADKTAMQTLVRAGYPAEAYQQLIDKISIYQKAKDSAWKRGIVGVHPITQARRAACSTQARTLGGNGEAGERTYSAQTRRLRTAAESYTKLDEALEALWTGNPRLAAMLAREGLEAMPHEGRFHYLLGTAAIHQARYSEAVEHLDKAVQSDPQYYDYALQRGIARAALGFAETARADLERSVELLSTAEAHYHLGDLDLEQRQPQSALVHFELAGAVESPVELLAHEQIARLEIIHKPTRYIHLKAAMDKRGFLTLAAVNKSPITVRDVMVAVETTPDANVVMPSRVVRFIDPISKGGKSSQYTGVGPFDSFDHMRMTLKAHVIGASPVKDD